MPITSIAILKVFIVPSDLAFYIKPLMCAVLSHCAPMSDKVTLSTMCCDFFHQCDRCAYCT